MRLLSPSKRAGKNSKPRISAKTAPTLIPIKRSGNDNSHTTGRRISARIASGQQSAKRRHHPTKRIRAFTIMLFRRYQLGILNSNSQFLTSTALLAVRICCKSLKVLNVSREMERLSVGTMVR